MPIYIFLATSQKILDAELKRMNFEGTLSIPERSGAATHLLRNKNDHLCAIVSLFDHNHEENQIKSLLAHEAVHIFQEMIREMREKNPSDEFQAWVIQKISQDLFYEYDKQMGKK